MEGSIIGIVGIVLALILRWLKTKDSPQETERRILEETKEKLDELANALARGDLDDAAGRFAEYYNRVLLKSPADNKGRNDGKTG